MLLNKFTIIELFWSLAAVVPVDYLVDAPRINLAQF